MQLKKSEFVEFNSHIKNMAVVPEYLPGDEEIDQMKKNLDKYLSYLFWVYLRYPRTGTEETEDILERIRPLLKNIHVRSEKS